MSKMSKISKWCMQNWWVLILVGIVTIIAIFVLIEDEGNIAKLVKFGDVASTLLTPTCLVLGLILGYPLLKRKLVDGYITKQFEIVHDADREVRRCCIILKDKYTPKMRSNALQREDLLSALEDIKQLYELAIDANERVYKYTSLVYNTLAMFEEKTRNTDINQGRNYTYKEVLHTWLYYHIMQIHSYSRSIGTMPSMEIQEKRVLVDRIDKYVVDNSYWVVRDIDKSIHYHHNDALLVVFASINNNYLDDNDWMLHKCSFKAAASPSPFAILMFNQCIYIPPMLTGEKVLNAFEEKLYLVSIKRKCSTQLSSGDKSYYYACMYANISEFGFVDIINSVDDLSKFHDSYLNIDVNVDGITKFEKSGQMLGFCITEEAIVNNYNKVAKRLKDKLESEIK